MNHEVSPLHSALMSLANEGDPVRVFTTFGMFDGIAKVDNGGGNVTLYSYRPANTGLRISGAEAAAETSGNGKWAVEESSPLMLAATAVQGVTAITTPRVNRW